MSLLAVLCNYLICRETALNFLPILFACYWYLLIHKCFFRHIKNINENVSYSSLNNLFSIMNSFRTNFSWLIILSKAIIYHIKFNFPHLKLKLEKFIIEIFINIYKIKFILIKLTDYYFSYSKLKIRRDD